MGAQPHKSPIFQGCCDGELDRQRSAAQRILSQRGCIAPVCVEYVRMRMRSMQQEWLAPIGMMATPWSTTLPAARCRSAHPPHTAPPRRYTASHGIEQSAPSVSPSHVFLSFFWGFIPYDAAARVAWASRSAIAAQNKPASPDDNSSCCPALPCPPLPPRCVPTGPTKKSHPLNTQQCRASVGRDKAVVGVVPILGGVEEAWWEVGVGDGDGLG